MSAGRLTEVGSEPGTTLKRLAVKGTIWTILGFGGSQVLRLGFNLAAARLLYPELFGLMALVNMMMTALALFSNAGIEAAVVRDPRGVDPEFLNTAWTVQVLRGVLLACLCCLLAWPVAWFYGDKRLLWLLPVVGLSNISAGFNSTSLLKLKRNMEVRELVAFELGSQFLSGSIMVLWAWLNPSIWALAAAPLSWTLIRLIWSHLLSPRGDSRLEWDRAALDELLRFGRWIWISSALSFLALQVDRLILGKLLDWSTLGIYGLVAAMAELPRSLIFAIGSNVIYPAFAKSAGLSRAELRRRVLRNRWPLLVAAGLPIAILAVTGDLMVRKLYDARYAAGAWMLPVLALGIWPSALANTIDSSLIAIGQPKRPAVANLMKIVFTVTGIPLGFHWMGVAGAVMVVALNDLPYYGQIVYSVTKEGLGCWAQDLTATALLAVVCALLLFMRSALGLGSPVAGMF